MIFLKKKIIKIPTYISLIYFKTKRLIIIKYNDKLKYFYLNLKFHFLILKNKISIINNFIIENSKNTKYKLKSQKNILNVIIKLFLIEIENNVYKKLNLIGVGYKVQEITKYNKKILLFKFGLSHFIYFNIINSIFIFCLKTIKIFVNSFSFYNLQQFSGLIKSLKYPEPYKGKGVRYSNEKIILKLGKKT